MDQVEEPGERRLSLPQRLITRLMPKRAAEIERQSREWIVICSDCANERSYWEIGGVRYRAKSAGKRVRMACPVCGRSTWHRVEHRPNTLAA